MFIEIVFMKQGVLMEHLVKSPSQPLIKKAGWLKQSPAFLAGDFSPNWKALLIP